MFRVAWLWMLATETLDSDSVTVQPLNGMTKSSPATGTAPLFQLLATPQLPPAELTNVAIAGARRSSRASTKRRRKGRERLRGNRGLRNMRVSHEQGIANLFG